MDFKSFRKEILSGNGSVKDLVVDFFKKIDKSNQNLNASVAAAISLHQLTKGFYKETS